MESVDPSSHDRRRRYFQFGLRSMLALTALLGLFLGLSAHQARNREQALRTVRQLGGTVHYNNDAPEFVNRLLGEDWFCRVVAIDLAFTEVKDTDLERARGELAQLKTISWIRISGTSVSYRGARSLGDAVPHATIYYGPYKPFFLPKVRNRIPMPGSGESRMQPSLQK